MFMQTPFEFLSVNEVIVLLPEILEFLVIFTLDSPGHPKSDGNHT